MPGRTGGRRGLLVPRGRSPHVASAKSTPCDSRCPQESDSVTPSKPAINDRAEGGPRALILVVERDPHVRELESYFLERAGFDVEFASDGEEALARTRELNPSIVITEILVPRLDGLALCRRLKAGKETRHIRVVVFSVLATSSRAREAGADAFLLKPLAEHELVSTVERLIALGART